MKLWFDSDSVIGKRARMIDRGSMLFGEVGRVLDEFVLDGEQFYLVEFRVWTQTVSANNVRIEER